MKSQSLFIALSLAAGLSYLLNSCKKEVLHNNVTPSTGVMHQSFTEDFVNIYSLLENTGWKIQDNSAAGDSIMIISVPWGQGASGTDKAGNPFGFTAYSYSSDPNEYIYSGGYVSDTDTVSSWLITPVLSVKNGDKISFYTRCDDGNYVTERLQVLLSPSGSPGIGTTKSSVGDFTSTLFDINPSEQMKGYPATWTRYEYTFTGLSSPADIRIAFRHYLVNPVYARGVGLDAFRFDVK